MSSSNYKVLVDISVAQLNNSGIPLDSKWLFVDLLKQKDLDISGLIYPLDWKNYNFAVKSDKPDILSFSTYLTFFDKEPILLDKALFLMRFKERLKRYLKTYFKRNFKLWLKDTDLFNDAIFRIFFESGVNVEDKRFIDNSRFYITDFFKETVYSRFTKNKKFLTPILDTRGFDFIINQDSLPIKVSQNTTQIIRYHDSIPMLNPDLTNGSYSNSLFHYKATKECIKNGAYYVCNSNSTAKMLCKLFPEIGDRVKVIPYSIPSTYKHVDNQSKLLEIFQSKLVKDLGFDYTVWKNEFKQYSDGTKKLLFISNVSTIEPRKNQLNLLKAYIEARNLLKKEGKDLKIVLVGSLGWKNELVLKLLKTLVENGDALLLENSHPEELKYIYSHAQAFVFPSYSEGFGLPPVEAMRCGTPVISSEIEVHKEIQGDSSYYVDPYNIKDIADKVVHLVKNRDSKEVKDNIKKGIKRSHTYNRESVVKQWNELFNIIYNSKSS